MSDNSRISWTDATWSPITGCSKVSPGCSNCYISRTPPFRKAHRRFERVGNAMTTGVQLHHDRLDQPLHWRRPRRIFVCSMSDLFREDVPATFLTEVLNVMEECEVRGLGHTFQILTKRPERMLLEMRNFYSLSALKDHLMPFVWLGVSVENQYWADRRIPLLLQTPAAVRFLSVEPLLKPVDLSQWLRPERMEYDPDGGPVGYVPHEVLVDWVIVGGESGPRHREMDPAWVGDIRDQCVAAGVPIFVKQDSGAKPGQQGRLSDDLWALKEFPHAAIP
jgi:protein gp37